MDIKEEILDLYFNEKMKQKDIANILKISKYKVSRTASKHIDYQKEKEDRKRTNYNKHKKETKKLIYQKRANQQIENIIIRLQHVQASRELSSNMQISNRAFKKCNSSIYRYNPKTKTYKLKSGINVTYDVPKSINWKGL